MKIGLGYVNCIGYSEDHLEWSEIHLGESCQGGIFSNNILSYDEDILGFGDFDVKGEGMGHSDGSSSNYAQGFG